MRKNDKIFSLGRNKPQRYFPTSIKADVTQYMNSKNAPLHHTELSRQRSDVDANANQLLIGYVLPMLPTAPLFVHNFQLKVIIPSTYYSECQTLVNSSNRGKMREERIGKAIVKYVLYPNGTVMVYCNNSRYPHRVQDDEDRSRIIAFLGQVRDRLVLFLNDLHEQAVPDITGWELTQFDMNKDIVVSDRLLVNGLKIHVKHFDYLLRVYIKPMGKDTVARAETTSVSKTSAVRQVIDGLDPARQVNAKLDLLLSKFDRMEKHSWSYGVPFPYIIL